MLVQLWMWWQKSEQKKQQKIRWVKRHPPQSSIKSTNQEHQPAAATSISSTSINQHRTVRINLCSVPLPGSPSQTNPQTIPKSIGRSVQSWLNWRCKNTTKNLAKLKKTKFKKKKKKNVNTAVSEEGKKVEKVEKVEEKLKKLRRRKYHCE